VPVNYAHLTSATWDVYVLDTSKALYLLVLKVQECQSTHCQCWDLPAPFLQCACDPCTVVELLLLCAPAGMGALAWVWPSPAAWPS
jgi:hypothetical protein